MNIRKAEVADIPAILPFLKHFSDYYPSKKKLWPGEEYATLRLRELIEAHVCIVAERSIFVQLGEDPEEHLEVAGVIAGWVLPSPMNPDIILLAEAFLWVEPVMRGAGAGLKLVEAYIQAGEAMAGSDFGAGWITMSLLDQSPEFEKYLLLRGFKATERSYLLEVEPKGMCEEPVRVVKAPDDIRPGCICASGFDLSVECSVHTEVS